MISATLLALSGPLALYYVSQIIYNIFFHPLRHFPGPKFASVSWWYTTYYEVFCDGAFLEKLEELHEQYGPVVRIAPNELHFKGLQYHRDIYVNGSKFQKDPRLYSTFHEDESSFCFIDPQEAKIRRDILNPLFSRRAIIKLEGYIQATVKHLYVLTLQSSNILSKVNKFVNRLVEESAKPIDIHRAYRCTTLEIILSYCFARDFDILSAADFRDPLILAVEAIMPLALVFKHFPFVYGMLLGLDGLFKRFRQDSFGPGELMDSLSQQIDELLEEPELLQQQTHDTIYHHLLTPKAAKGGPSVIPSKKSLLEEAMNLVAAGSDTVGNTCTVGTFYILNNPTILSSLRRELRDAWPDLSVPVKYEALEKLPYLVSLSKFNPVATKPY
ncbi:hypothetical protein ONZ45_g19506 [Pleurotus djamor]|nr:hypothetical protein ONZ45_g19506 [Pleurotus djamor]